MNHLELGRFVSEMEFLQQVEVLFLATIVVRPVWVGMFFFELTSVAQFGRGCGAGVRPLAHLRHVGVFSLSVPVCQLRRLLHICSALPVSAC